MPCYHPIKGFRSLITRPNGKRGVVLSKALNSLVDPGESVTVPCGRCIGCRLEHSRQWAVRCMHEASLYEHNQFVTLTYDEKHLPKNLSLDRDAFRLFMRRLRKFSPGVRYFHCGEYGDENSRPHYHAVLFNLYFPDRLLWTIRNGEPHYSSKILTEIWGQGNATTTDVTFEGAAYVARYCTKKLSGKALEEMNDKGLYPYERYDAATGDVWSVEPEYATMSRRPGIGAGWFDKWKAEVYPADSVVVRGKECKPPKFYDAKLEAINPQLSEKIKEERKQRHFEKHQDSTPQRLLQREKVKRAAIKSLVRSV